MRHPLLASRAAVSVDLPAPAIAAMADTCRLDPCLRHPAGQETERRAAGMCQGGGAALSGASMLLRRE